MADPSEDGFKQGMLVTINKGMTVKRFLREGSTEYVGRVGQLLDKREAHR